MGSNVIAEFLSNAWDADAETVEIDLISNDSAGQTIQVIDDGVGMSRSEIIEKFLHIGRNRRTSPDEKTPGGRGLMGRKGIGKLAGFGIAQTVDVISVPNGRRRASSSTNDPTVGCCWLRFHLPDIIEQGQSGSYNPKVIADNLGPDEMDKIAEDYGISAQIGSFLKNVRDGGGGVCIRLTDTTLKRTVNPDILLSSMGRRFTVTMLRDDFKVLINSRSITPKDALPSLQDFCIGTWENPKKETLTINGVSREISYWISFVDLKDSDWSIENAGIGIYAHGKIAQDRPFFFNVKGKEILSRYMYGVIEADWLDELPEDIVSTDRRSIDWDSDLTVGLHEWGEAQLTDWLEKYRKWRLDLPKKEIVDKIRAQNKKLTPTEEDALADLLSEVFTELGNNEDAKDKTANRITSAWTHDPTRRLTQSLWKKVFSKDKVAPEAFSNLLDELNASLVPEAMGLAVTMAQRIGAITAMTRMIENEKSETHLQRLIEAHPWLIEPRLEFLTANQQIRTLVEKKHKPDAERGEWSLTKKDGSLKPDFVFLSDPSVREEIVVFELKGPECEKTLQPVEYDQLGQYLTIIDRVYNQDGLKVHGVLVGHDKGGFGEHDRRIKVRRWSEILQEARFLHVTYLDALLKASNPAEDDARMEQIRAFGGDETIELLSKYSSQVDFPQIVQDSLQQEV